MNIVIATDYAFVNGGAGKVALGSAVALAAAGHNVFLFTAVGPVAPELKDIPGLTTICTGQFEILVDPNRVRAIVQGFWNTKAARLLDDLLGSLNPDETLVHIHLWAKALSSSIAQVTAKRGFRLVFTLHDFLSVCPNGTLFNHRTQEICNLEPMSLRCWCTNCDTRKYSHKVWRVGRQLVQSKVGHLPAGIRDFISISDLSEKIVAPLLPTGSRFHRISNFVEAEKRPPSPVGKNGRFLYVGRLAREKGILLWAECARRISVKARFVGDGDLKGELASQYPEAELTGWLDSAAIRAELEKARALIFPSLWYETQGLVVAEAASMGIPVIVADTSAAREWVVDGSTGLWFRGGDLDDLADKVQRLRDDAQFAEVLGKEAYRHYWARPATLADHVTELERLYRSILADGCTPEQMDKAETFAGADQIQDHVY